MNSVMILMQQGSEGRYRKYFSFITYRKRKILVYILRNVDRSTLLTNLHKQSADGKAVCLFGKISVTTRI